MVSKIKKKILRIVSNNKYRGISALKVKHEMEFRVVVKIKKLTKSLIKKVNARIDVYLLICSTYFSMNYFFSLF